MKIILALLVGLGVGGGLVWYYNTGHGRSLAARTERQIESAADSARDAIQEKLRGLNLRSEDIKEELARTGQVVRRKAAAAGEAIVDRTADARITAAIKAKLVTSRELSVLSISVNTTEGLVTLSGTVNAAEDISRAMLLAMETDGVREVVSTLHVGQKRREVDTLIRSDAKALKR